MDKLEVLIKELYSSIKDDSFARLTLSKPIDKTSGVKKIIIRMAMIKEKRNFSFVYRHPTKDITKNHSITDGADLIVRLIQTEYEIANFFTTEKHFSIEKLDNGKFKLKVQKHKTPIKATRSHDKVKTSLLTKTDYLISLGILNKKEHIQKDKGDKYKQINKYVEIVDGILRKNKNLSQLDPMHIVDMGSGKGYLTFALYDYLKNHSEQNVRVRGIEMRSDLVDICNGISNDVGFEHLSFEQGTIQKAKVNDADILIALHACDTATDDAIARGIEAKAKLIICSPCCHKQVRKDLQNEDSAIQSIYQHGILMERQAEIVTDTIRALVLQMHGYKTSVFEFISTEHTGKNLMITAIKHNEDVDVDDLQSKIDALKKVFGVRKHYLEEAL